MYAIHRRHWVKQSSAIALSPLPAAFCQPTFASSPNPDQRRLVVVQLSGGNDGINTVVPSSDEAYAKHRKSLRLPTDRLLTLSDEVALHPAMQDAADLFEDGRMSIVQAVGYPQPNRSHEVSMAIWQSARTDPREHQSHGWLGRALDNRNDPSAHPDMVLMGDEAPPLAIRGRRSSSLAMSNLDDLQLASEIAAQPVPEEPSDNPLLGQIQLTTARANQMATMISDANLKRKQTRYPATKLAGRLADIATLIKADFATPVYYAIQSGYDTHAAQLPRHARLLRELSTGVKAFLDDMEASGLADRVVVMAFSEFGRRVVENASSGTDHGAAGPMLLAGRPVSGKIIGDAPCLSETVDGDVPMRVDFRRVYATVLQRWLGVPSASAVGERFTTLPGLFG